VADREEFAGFVAGRSSRLLRTAYLLTRDWGQAEDLLQTALARTWLAWSRLDEDPEPYVRKVLVNTYASWWRRKWRGETPHGELPESATADPNEGLGERDAIWQALGRLPRRQRAVLVLRYFEDLTEAQTADVLGISAGTVKSQTSKALARLRLDDSLSRAPVTNGATP
jgi:RNA polymerase sigma-70 factor (sigma-E family)